MSELREDTSAARADETAANGTLGDALLATLGRGQAAYDREQAADDREQAADDREQAADDRDEAARARADAAENQLESAAAAARALETLESMSDAFFTLDSEWRFTYLNPQTEPLLERRRQDLVGTVAWREFPSTRDSAFETGCRTAIRDRVPVRFEAIYGPLGRWFEVRAYPVTDGLAVYFRDVTNERALEARSREGQRLEALGRVTAGVAHDFNNLLTSIAGYANLGQAAGVDEQTTSYFDEIESASQMAAAMTRQLLVFARRQELSPTMIDVNQVVGDLSSTFRQLLPEDVELRTELSPTPVFVFADRSQLDQVLLNLVLNGRDAITTTGVITLHTTNDEPAGLVHDVRVASGWLQVTDDGSGIPDDVLPNIFDPFFSTKPPEIGTGLGLATIYGIVAQSGGSIFVDSTVGLGTTMTVALPAQQL